MSRCQPFKDITRFQVVMDLPPLRVLILQMTSVDSVEENLKQVHHQLSQLSHLSSFDLISLPENSLYFHISKTKEKFLGMNLEDKTFVELQKYCDECDLCIHLGSVPLKVDKGVANATIWLSPKKIPRCVYQKIHLFDVEVEGHTPIRESDQFVHGHSPATIEMKGWKIGLSICYDLRFSELYSEYARRGVHALLIPSAFTVPTGRAHWHCLLRARAIESQCFVIAAAQSGSHPGSRRVTFGHSLAYGPWGQILGEIQKEGPGTLSLKLNPTLLFEARQQIPMYQHRRL